MSPWERFRRRAKPDEDLVTRVTPAGLPLEAKKRPPEGGLFCSSEFAYLRLAPRPAASRISSALSVFSHENAVKVLPWASFISYGVRPKWPFDAVGW